MISADRQNSDGGEGGLPTAPSPPLNFFQEAFAGRKAIELILSRTESLGRASPSAIATND